MNTAVMQHDVAHHQSLQEEVQHRRTSPITVTLFWLLVGVPMSWGVWSTIQKASALFY